MPPLVPADKAGRVAGVDEAGRGCLAGPVVAAAVVLPAYVKLPGLADSKLLSPAERARLEPLIKARALAWAVGVSWPPEIDERNVLRATLLAMSRAVRALKLSPEELLVDGNQCIPEGLVGFIPQRAIVDGDRLVRCISAASVLAKTFRDRLMGKLERLYPGYGFARHKGYGTREHLQALIELGPSRMHRLTFRGVKPEPADAGEHLCLPGL
ncbi:MAG: ribonuclease HII [Desulfocurvibacter africanus]